MFVIQMDWCDVRNAQWFPLRIYFLSFRLIRIRMSHTRLTCFCLFINWSSTTKNWSDREMEVVANDNKINCVHWKWTVLWVVRVGSDGWKCEVIGFFYSLECEMSRDRLSIICSVMNVDRMQWHICDAVRSGTDEIRDHNKNNTRRIEKNKMKWKSKIASTRRMGHHHPDTVRADNWKWHIWVCIHIK